MSKLTVGGVTVDEVLVDYDGPRLFVSRGEDGVLRLGLSVVDDGERAQFCLVPVSDAVLAGIRSGTTTLREPFETAQGGLMITITPTGTETSPLSGPLEHLPDRGVRLTDLTTPDVAVRERVAPAAIQFAGVIDLVQRVKQLIEHFSRQRAAGLRFAASNEVRSHEHHPGLGAFGLGPELRVSVDVEPGSELVTLTVSVDSAGLDSRELPDAVLTLDAGPGGQVVRRRPLEQSGAADPLTARFPNLDVGAIRRIEIEMPTEGPS